MVLGGGFTSPLFDGFDNLYMGQPGLMIAYPPTQWVRWRTNVIGMPTTTRFLAPGQLLVVTHLGQVLVFDAHRGEVAGTPLDLVEGVNPTDPFRGLTDCQQSLPGCPVAAPPAYSRQAESQCSACGSPAPRPRCSRPALSARPVGAADAGVDQRRGGRRCTGQPGALPGRRDGLHQWTRQPVVGAQRSRRQAEMVCSTGVSAADTAVSLAPGGLIIAGGGPDTRLVAIKDSGDHADVVWRRDDVTPLTTSSQAGAQAAYTVVADGAQRLSLLVFNPADGGRTLNTYPLPEAAGFPVGVSVGFRRQGGGRHQWRAGLQLQPGLTRRDPLMPTILPTPAGAYSASRNTIRLVSILVVSPPCDHQPQAIAGGGSDCCRDRKRGWGQRAMSAPRC